LELCGISQIKTQNTSEYTDRKKLKVQFYEHVESLKLLEIVAQVVQVVSLCHAMMQ
jgi:hypothetical protein